MTNPFTGFGYFFRGLGLITKPGVKRWVAIPLTINILLFAFAIRWVSGEFSGWVDDVVPNLWDWLFWLEWVLWVLFAITIGLILFFTFTMVANLIGSPFNGYLAAAVEEHLTGRKPPDTGRSLWAEAIHAIVNELKKWLYFLLWAIPLLLLSFVPVINLFSPIYWPVFGAWMLSLEYLDYPMGNHGKGFREVREAAAAQRFMSLGFGGAATLATMVPLLNFFAMPVAVAGATAYWVEQVKNRETATLPGGA
ncbi:MAG TPA: sulfate transporter CysZ [Gammaproteobacteria bacterium]|nr:sulfate transporter CysZ [Gammaproteobacteria bacterium]